MQINCRFIRPSLRSLYCNCIGIALLCYWQNNPTLFSYFVKNKKPHASCYIQSKRKAVNANTEFETYIGLSILFKKTTIKRHKIDVIYFFFESTNWLISFQQQCRFTLNQTYPAF